MLLFVKIMYTRSTCLIMNMNKDLCNIWFEFKTIHYKTMHYEDTVCIKVHRERDRCIIRGKEVKGTMLRDYREYLVP